MPARPLFVLIENEHADPPTAEEIVAAQSKLEFTAGGGLGQLPPKGTGPKPTHAAEPEPEPEPEPKA